MDGPVCGGKRSYSKNGAEKAKEWVGRRRGKAVRIYECPKCHWHHLTSHKGDRDDFVKYV